MERQRSSFRLAQGSLEVTPKEGWTVPDLRIRRNVQSPEEPKARSRQLPCRMFSSL